MQPSNFWLVLIVAILASAAIGGLLGMVVAKLLKRLVTRFAESRQERKARKRAQRRAQRGPSVADYRERFRSSLAGRWGLAVGTATCVMDELWEFFPDGTGRIEEQYPLDGSNGITLFEWRAVDDFIVACRVTKGPAGSDNAEPYDEDDEWMTMRYDFKRVRTDCDDEVALHQVGDDGRLIEGFWFTVEPLAYVDKW